MPCIYCKTTDHLTEEHVFSAFSGGNIVVKDGSCSKCNGECSKFEDKVASATETARHIFEIPNRYGRVPDAAVKIDVQGTKLAAVSIDGRRKPGGEIELHDFVMDTKTEDGKKVREGFFVSEEGARKFVERRRARGEKVTEIEAPGEVILVPNSQQTIEFAFSPAARQMAAKIALTSVAYVYGTQYACLPQFDALRQCIFRDATKIPSRIFANRDFVADHIRTPHEHSVRAYLSAGMHKGWAVVTLFGGLSYIVELTGEFNEAESRKYSLFYNTASRTTFNPIVLYDEQEIVGRILSHDTIFEQQEAVDAQWYPIVDRYCGENEIELSRIMPKAN
jgi:hypothetical protein